MTKSSKYEYKALLPLLETKQTSRQLRHHKVNYNYDKIKNQTHDN